jgi:general secretion pathway protein D
MKSGRIVGALLLVFCLAVAANADQANAAFKRGVQAESKNKYDEAFQAFSEAHNLKPRDAKYFTAFTRLRFYAAGEHIRQGQLLRDSGKLQEALAEFQRAAAIDPTNFVAKGEARHTEEMIKKQAQAHAGEEPKKVQPLEKQAAEAAGPVELQPLSNTLITLRLTESSTNVYKTVGRLAGINVLFDQDYKAQKITVELNDVTLREALNTVALQTKTFWEAISSNSILVAADTASKRKEMQDSVMKTFYLRNVSNPAELQEVANTLRGILDVTRIQLVPKQNAMIIRGTTDQLVLVQKLLSDIDKPKPEVVIEVAVLQVSRTRIRTIGVNPPTSANVVMVPNATGGASGGSGSGAFTINTLGKLTADNFQVSIPGASLSYLMSDGDTRLIQNPQIRAVDNEKATLKIGDRVPVATGSFGAAAGGGGISALVNTQFQYLDVGVNIDITPHIHADNEVTLKMTLEVSSVSGTQNIGGISQPVIGQRRIEHEARLQDGEVNLVGGILEDTETNSLSGYPLLTKIPILKYLFAQEDKQRRENEIVFAITPHIIRAQEVNDDNLRMVDLGRGNSVSVGHSDPRGNSAAARGMDQNSGRTVGQRKNTMPPVASPAPTKSVEPPKAPVQQVPVSTATSSLMKPAKAAEPEGTPPARTALQAENNVPVRPSPHEEDIPPLRAAAAAVSISAAPSVPAPVSSAAVRPVDKTARNANHPATSQPTAEQCPSGTRLVGTEGGVITCSFD